MPSLRRILGRRVSSLWLLAWLLLVAGVITLVLRGNSYLYGVRMKVQDLEAISRSMQLDIERYVASEQDPGFPETMHEIYGAPGSAEYALHAPENPYSNGKTPMPAVAVGDHVPGGYTYLPQFANAPNGRRYVTDFVLLYYGDAAARRDVLGAPKRWVEPRPLPGGAEARVAWDYVVFILEYEDPKIHAAKAARRSASQRR